MKKAYAMCLQPFDIDTSGRVEVRKSQVHGMGVFALTRIAKRTRLGKYTGEKLKGSELNARYPDSHPEYTLKVGNWYIDAAHKNGNWTRRVNDSYGTRFRNNCKFTARGCLVATCNIQPGEELFVSYGRGFWNNIKRME